MDPHVWFGTDFTFIYVPFRKNALPDATFPFIRACDPPEAGFVSPSVSNWGSFACRANLLTHVLSYTSGYMSAHFDTTTI